MTELSTRQKLVDVALRLFHEQGYAATGISTILREAGVNSGSLYHFFPTKEALLLSVLDRYMEKLDPEVMEPAFATTTDPVAKIFAMLDGYRHFLVLTNCSMGCPIGNLALELSDTYPEVRDKICGLFDAWCSRVERCLNDASDRLPKEVNRQSLARFVLTVMEGGMMQARSHRNLDPYDASVAHLRTYFEQLMQAASAQSSQSK